MRRHEWAAKRGREDVSPPAQQREQQQQEYPNKRGRIERRQTPVSASRVPEQGGRLPAQQIPQSRHSGGQQLRQPAAVLGAAAMSLQAGQGNHAWYEELQQRAAQHQVQQQSQGLAPQQVITRRLLWWTTCCCLTLFVKWYPVPCCSVVSLMPGLRVSGTRLPHNPWGHLPGRASAGSCNSGQPCSC